MIGRPPARGDGRLGRVRPDSPDPAFRDVLEVRRRGVQHVDQRLDRHTSREKIGDREVRDAVTPEEQAAAHPVGRAQATIRGPASPSIRFSA